MTENLEGQKVRSSTGRLLKVRVSFLYTDSVTGTQYLLIHFTNGRQERRPV